VIPPVPGSRTSVGTDREAIFWQSIQNSPRRADFADYLARFPNGAFASLARRRMEGLAVASLPPSFTVEELEETYTALKTANVGAAPTTTADKLGRLPAGVAVEVTGKTAVKGRPWWRVALADGKIGFVWGPLLGSKAKDLYTIVLPDSGLTLGDWVLLAEDRLQDGEHVALLTEADKLRRQYGDFPELNKLLARAVLGDIRSRQGLQRVGRAAMHMRRFGNLPGLGAELDAAVSRTIEPLKMGTEGQARRTLASLVKLKELAGPSQSLLAKRARAHHRLGAFEAAAGDYAAWISQAGRNHPDRKKMAQGLVKARRGDALGPGVGDVFKDCDDCPEMVVVPAGSFRMGDLNGGGDSDEKPVNRVKIPTAFAVGKYEVTWLEWIACVRGGGCDGTGPHGFGGDEGWGRGRRPVINVSWNDAKSYILWISRRTGESYRLLSEAEWEYAARAGTTTAFHTGNRITTDQANFDGKHSFNGSDKGSYRKRTVPVGSFQPNAFGLYDVHGNVWEWVEDCWNGSYQGAPADGSAWMSGDCKLRVLRGGSWFIAPRNLRAADRLRNGTGGRVSSNGFRLARTLSR
jgi:formylglycine-generating enzyme required for sulfatase activity